MLKGKKFQKGVVLFTILLLPSILYLVLTTGEHLFDRLPIIGPRKAVTVVNEEGKTEVDTLYHTIPDFELTDQNGKPFGSDDLEGKIYVANFFFTSCPSICPTMTFHMGELQKHFNLYPEVHLLSFTVDPERDSAEALMQYAHENRADTNMWTFLTGNKDSIYQLAFKGFFVNAMEDELAPGGFLHSEYFVLVDKHGRIRSGRDKDGNIRSVYDGTKVKHLKALKEDMKVLIREYRMELKENNKFKEDGEI